MMGATRFRTAVSVLAVIVASLFSRTAPASLDGAGLFALPADRVEAMQARGAVALRAVSSGMTRWKAVLPALRQAYELGVVPKTWGFTGFGVQISGKM